MKQAIGSAEAPTLQPGFANPVFDSQAVFRTAMSATAYPGRLFSIDRSLMPPASMEPITAAFVLTLADLETPIWLQSGSPDGIAWLRFHCGTPIAQDIRSARFALISDLGTMPDLIEFQSGDVENPDHSATLFVEVPSLTEGPATSWSGPGINGRIYPRIAGLTREFWEQWALNRELYPQGIDVFFLSAASVIGLPRTISVEA